ncbi:AAA family ATPase [Actinospica durhamensis]|uniref:AAA family ATPase n=1 Tax=Actinospica durhamensis TaxID=1508375 RepID=A0A941EKI3_9ACTN|nr:YhaN family protein [Actinospica durhamensis]MBR7833267.1 AAA family ATPase [Actinospica durhamensis]
MRIDELDLAMFGCFTGQVLNLSGSGVHLVVGPNEAGKSTIRHAIAELLYGIDERTSYDFVHQYSDLRIAARLRAADGSVTAAVRHKRRNNPLTTPDGSPLDQRILTALTSGMERSEFTESFAIDHAALRRGGEALLAGQGNVSRALFESQSGMRLTGVLASLDKAIEDLFKARGKNPKLNAGIVRHREARARFRDATLKPEKYDAKAAEVAHARKQRDRIEEELKRARQEFSRLERVQRALPVLRRLEDAEAARVRLLEAGPLVGAEIGKTLADLRGGRQQAEETASAAAARRDRIAAQLADPALVYDARLLDQAEAIETLFDERQAVQEEEGRAALRRADALALRGEIDALLSAVRVSANLDTADIADDVVLRPGLAEQVAGLQEARTRLEAALEAAERQARKRREAHAKALNAVPADTGESGVSAENLKILIKAVPAGLGDRIADQRKQLAASRKKAEGHAARHGLPSGVETATLPGPEQVADHRARLEAAADDAGRVRQRIEDLTSTLDANRRKHAALLAVDPPPTEGLLETSRQQRDRLWADIAAALTQSPMTPLKAGASAEYAAAVAAADDIADRMRRDSQRVAERLQLEIDIDADQRLLARAETAAGQQAEERAAIEERWALLWAASGLAVPEPSAAPAVLAAVDNLRSLYEEIDEDLAALDLDVAAAVRWAGKIRAALPGTPLAADDVPVEADLGELLVLLEQRHETTLAALRAREKREGKIADAHAELASADQDLADCRARRDGWDRGWERFLADNQLTGDPAGVSATIAAYDEIARKRAEADEAEHTVRAADERVQAFTDNLVGVLDACGRPALADRARRYADVASLRKALIEHRALADRQSDLAARLAQADEEFAEADGSRLGFERALAALIAESGVDDEEALGRAVERTAAVDGLDGRIGTDVSTLADFTSVPLPTLRVEAAEWEDDPDRLRAWIIDAQASVDHHDAELKSQIKALAELEVDLNAMDGSGRAAEASETAAEELAAVVEDSEDYLRLHVARSILVQCMEDYREANQHPVLTRAQQVFGWLTGGRFREFVTDTDAKGAMVFRARRADGTDVEVAALSEGTRDQLYLALRLASLDRYAEAGRAMPLLLDDVFMTFDDIRTEAGLAVLDEMADRFQVIMFTHHQHLVDLAASVLPMGRCHVHELSVFVPRPRVQAEPESGSRRDAGERLCRDCGGPLPAPVGRGRPAVRCDECRG